MQLLITGGAGFIGSNLVRMAVALGHSVTTLDALTYAGSEENLAGIDSARHTFIKGNICDASLVDSVIDTGRFDAVINCAAETHVDRSLSGARLFADTNVRGTATLLEACRTHGVKTFIQVSTDEVYGSITGNGSFTLDSPLRPSSPYSASKAGADLMALSFAHTWGMDVRITRCTNNYGPYQHPEKFIPTIITSALLGKPVPVYGDGLNVRDWISTDDHCRGILAVLDKGSAGSVYHFGGANEITNIDLCKSILREIATHVGESETKYLGLITFVEDRPGHDRRYSLDWSRTESELGWKPRTDWAAGIEEVVSWYLANRPWWETRIIPTYSQERQSP